MLNRAFRLTKCRYTILPRSAKKSGRMFEELRSRGSQKRRWSLVIRPWPRPLARLGKPKIKISVLNRPSSLGPKMEPLERTLANDQGRMTNDGFSSPHGQIGQIPIRLLQRSQTVSHQKRAIHEKAKVVRLQLHSAG